METERKMKVEDIYFVAFHKVCDYCRELRTSGNQGDLDKVREYIIDLVKAQGIKLKLGMNHKGPVIDVWHNAKREFFLEGASGARDAGAMYLFIADEIDLIDTNGLFENMLIKNLAELENAGN